MPADTGLSARPLLVGAQARLTMGEQTWVFVVPDERDHEEMLELTRSIHGEDSGLGDPRCFRWLAHEHPAGQAIMRVARETTTIQIIALV